MKSVRKTLPSPESTSPVGDVDSRGFRLSYSNRILLLALLYGVCINLALLSHRRYETGVFLVLGLLHVLSRVRFRSVRATPPWRATLPLLILVGGILVLVLSR